MKPKTTDTHNILVGCSRCQTTHTVFFQHPMETYDGGHDWFGNCIITGDLFMMKFPSDYDYHEPVVKQVKE